MKDSMGMLAVMAPSSRTRRFASEVSQRRVAASRGMSDYVSDAMGVVQLAAVWQAAVANGDAAGASAALLNASRIASNSQGDAGVPPGTSSILGAVASDAGMLGNQAANGDLDFANSDVYVTLNENAYRLGSVDSGNASGMATQDALLAQAIQNQPGLADRIMGGAFQSHILLCVVSPVLCAAFPNATVGDAVTALGGVTSYIGLTTPQSGADTKAKQNVSDAVHGATTATKKAACNAIPGATWDDATGCTLPDPSASIKRILVAVALGLVAIGAGYVAISNYARGRGMRQNNGRGRRDRDLPTRRPRPGTERHYVAKKVA